MIVMLRRWRHRRRCFHGQPGGSSYVVALAHLDYGRKLWACNRSDGGCGRRWVA